MSIEEAFFAPEVLHDVSAYAPAAFIIVGLRPRAAGAAHLVARDIDELQLHYCCERRSIEDIRERLRITSADELGGGKESGVG